MYRASITPYRLLFKEPAITSRSTMLYKDTFIIRIEESEELNTFGVGEVALFRGLSKEDAPDFQEKVESFCRSFSLNNMPNMSSFIFGVESALADLEEKKNGGEMETFRIPTNGLIWMGDKHTMYRRICEKLDAGFRCLKLKIGGIKFEEELELLRFIRDSFSPEALEIRLDANGSFAPETALGQLGRLSEYSIHSIEQPIKAGQPQEMRKIVEKSPIAIALDEELIGCWTDEERCDLLDEINPHYIILKPSLCGGFRSADKWIEEAENRNIGWWATSALESNIGLRAIARWVAKKNPNMPQGLGTGGLYTNNIPSTMRMEGECLVGC